MHVQGPRRAGRPGDDGRWNATATAFAGTGRRNVGMAGSGILSRSRSGPVLPPAERARAGPNQKGSKREGRLRRLFGSSRVCRLCHPRAGTIRGVGRTDRGGARARLRKGRRRPIPAWPRGGSTTGRRGDHRGGAAPRSGDCFVACSRHPQKHLPAVTREAPSRTTGKGASLVAGNAYSAASRRLRSDANSSLSPSGT